MMIGCIRCHGPTDESGDCYICDSEKMRTKLEKAKEKASLWTTEKCEKILGLSKPYFKNVIGLRDAINKDLRAEQERTKVYRQLWHGSENYKLREALAKVASALHNNELQQIIESALKENKH